MVGMKTGEFRKGVECPSSESLLAFESESLSRIEQRKVADHLAVCEFCLAECDLYRHVPQSTDDVPLSMIPAPLFELAQALLRNGSSDCSSLNILFSDYELPAPE